MSAHLVNPEHIGILAAVAVIRWKIPSEWEHSRFRTHDNMIATAQRIAKGFAMENIRSVAYRYPDDVSGSRPGPCLSDLDYEEACAIYAAHFVKHPQPISPVQLIKLLDSLEYQSCEHPDWVGCLAHKQLQILRRDAIYNLPGYDKSDWSYDRAVPEIEALYDRN